MTPLGSITNFPAHIYSLVFNNPLTRDTELPHRTIPGEHFKCWDNMDQRPTDRMSDGRNDLQGNIIFDGTNVYQA